MIHTSLGLEYEPSSELLHIVKYCLHPQVPHAGDATNVPRGGGREMTCGRAIVEVDTRTGKVYLCL